MRVLRRSTVVLACRAGLVATAHSASASADGLMPFAGAWTRVEIESDDERRLSAIDRAVAGLSWMTRQVVAPILKSSTAPPAAYEFVVEADRVWMRPTGEALRALPLDGSSDSGDGPRGRYTRSARVVDGAIETRWQQSDATGSNRYRVVDGTLLVVEHTIHVTRLEGVDPIQYESRFRRAPDVASAPR